MSEYTDNMLGQPGALRALLGHLELDSLRDIAARVQAGAIDRIILTGMGASLCAAYPAWEILAAAGLPAWWLETGELLQSARRLITPRSLLWMVSQGGKGPEAQALLDALAGQRPSLVLATTNEPASPLAARVDLVQPLHTTVEHGVATRTFVNTLAVTQLAALSFTGKEVGPSIDALHAVAEGLEAYLAAWDQSLAAWSKLLPSPDRLVLVGRGASLAAALDGALVLKEAARLNAEAISMGQFRHGPLELADARLTVIVFEGEGPLRAADRKLAQTVVECGGRALWGGAASDDSARAEAPVPVVPTPAGEGVARPIAQILPVQFLSLHAAQAAGFEAAAFRHLGKVTWPQLTSAPAA